MEELYKILPFVIGAAVSPVLLVTTLLILAQTNRPVIKTTVFLLGSALTITAITLVIFYTSTIRSIPAGTKEVFPHIIIGLLLLLLALDIYRRGPAKPNPKAKAQGSKGMLRYFLLGIVLMLTNFTTIAMVFAVAVELRSGDVAGVSKLIYTMATILSSLLPILLPLGVLVIAGKHSAVILNTLSSFMKRYAHIITAIFFALLGVFSLLKPFIS